MNDCEMSERSARGYCPGTTGHADELCDLHDGVPIYCEGAAEVSTEATHVQVLPYTGADGTLGVFGGVLLVVGFLVLKVGQLCFGDTRT
jgi:hypothetical protein